MANITAAEVNKLRKQTGAGMMDCKNALVESEGDFEKAIDILRKKGQKVANKRADREASEGVIIAKTTNDNKKGIIISLNCETDFVAKNKDFVNFANQIIDTAINNLPTSLEALKSLTIGGRTIQDLITENTGIIGEKIELSQYEIIEAEHVSPYIHHGNRLATLVGISKSSEKLNAICHELAMQVAAMNPMAIDNENVSQEVIAREIEIGKEQARLEGKPEEMLEKIALGKLNKFYKESTLLNQDYIRDTKKTIKQLLSEVDKDVKIVAFKRVAINE